MLNALRSTPCVPRFPAPRSSAGCRGPDGAAGQRGLELPGGRRTTPARRGLSVAAGFPVFAGLGWQVSKSSARKRILLGLSGAGIPGAAEEQAFTFLFGVFQLPTPCFRKSVGPDTTECDLEAKFVHSQIWLNGSEWVAEAWPIRCNAFSSTFCVFFARTRRRRSSSRSRGGGLGDFLAGSCLARRGLGLIGELGTAQIGTAGSFFGRTSEPKLAAKNRVQFLV